MTRKRKEFPILENITITDVAAEGKALARVDDMVVFVPFVVPGDVDRPENPEEKTSLLRSDSREVPPNILPFGPYLSARISEFAAVASGSVSHIKNSSNTSNSKFWIILPVSVR